MNRYKLPLFVKLFSCYFIVGGVLLPVIIVYHLFYDQTFRMLGLSTANPLSFEGLLIMFFWIAKAIIGYGLIRRRSWALRLALFDAIISLVTYLIATLLPFTYYNPADHRTITLEILFLIPYLYVISNLNRKQQSLSFS